MPLPKPNRSIVMGLGNPLLTDDAIGIIAGKKAKEKLKPLFPDVSFRLNYSGGLDMMYEMIGFDNAIFLDAIETGKAEHGDCLEFCIDELMAFRQPRLVDTHGLNLPTVLETGRRCGYNMPGNVVIYAIEGRNFTDFSESPTPAVAASLPRILKKVESQLFKWKNLKPEE